MTYEEYKKYTRSVFPNISCKEVKNFHKTYFPEQYTVADTPPMTNQVLWQTNQKEEGINPMFDDEMVPCAPTPRMVFKKAAVANAQIINAVPVEATQRDYTIERVKALGEKYAQALRVQFYMDNKAPQSAVDLIAAIKDGNYILNDVLLAENADGIKAGYYGIFYGIHWGQLPDPDGYEAAKEVLKAAAQKALDGATLKPIDQLEAVIEDFEGWKL